MKYFPIIFALMLSVLSLSAQINQKDENGLKTGRWMKKYSNGKIRYSGQFKADKPIGDFKYYNTNGQLSSTIHYFKNSDLGAVKLFFPRGKVRATGFYRNRIKDSVWNYYDASTFKLKAVEHYKLGKKDGEWLIYFDNGKISSSYHYQKDTLDGPWKEYFLDGTRRLSANYKRGYLQGKYIIFASDGRIIEEGNYQGGVRHGDWISYDKEGNRTKVEKYRNGWAYLVEYYKKGVLTKTVDNRKAKKSK